MTEPKAAYRTSIYHRLVQQGCDNGYAAWMEAKANERREKRMSQNYSHSRTDANHAEIREAVRKAGYKWIDTYRQGDGCPDAIVLSKSRRWLAFEIKSDGGGLTKAEKKMFDYVGDGAPLFTIPSIEAALELLAFYDQKGN